MSKRRQEGSEGSPVTQRVRLREGQLLPNVLVTGTPGTGKSAIALTICANRELTHLSVSDFAKSLNAFDGWDKERECHILDEDKLLDAMEEKLGAGGYVVEYHACDFFPERWFDLVVVLRARTEVLFDRLTQRGYAAEKVRENLTCEITDLLLQEAKESYAHEIVVELQNNDTHDFDSNMSRILQWYDTWLTSRHTK